MIEKGSVTGLRPLQAIRRRPALELPQVPDRPVIAPDGKTVHSFDTRVELDSREVMGKLTPMLK
jgi:hypothetical protein